MEARTNSRRDRNKQEKQARIIAAASELFAAHGVDEVTTQQIAERADVGAGTLFLYAGSKAELLLMVQNARYAASLERGRTDAADATDVVGAVMALVAPIVECNRVQVSNGRTYLREMAFGDPTEPHRREARSIAAETERSVTEAISAWGQPDAAETRAQIVNAIAFMAMAGAPDDASDDDILAAIRHQITTVLTP